MPEYVAVIPTALPKEDWLNRTIFGLMHQTCPPSKIFVGYDIKPHDDFFLPLQEYSEIVVTKQYKFDNEWKHQHEIVNRMVEELTDPEDIVLIMDDDYWIQDVRGMENLLDAYQSESLAFVTHYQSVDGYMPSVSPWVSGDHIFYFNDPKDRNWNESSTLEKDCYHIPLCGHPKVIMSKDFMSVGGFDYLKYRHYWYCDVDLYLKIKAQFKIIEVDTRGTSQPIHLNHPRHKVFTFTAENYRIFKEDHPDYRALENG